MHFGPILRALLRHRARFLLIALEVALTLAIIVNCWNIILDSRETILRPSGMDEEKILAVMIRPHESVERNQEANEAARAADERALQALPGVRAASNVSSMPLSGGGSAGGRKPEGFEGDSFSTPYMRIGQQGIEAMGVELIEGRDFRPEDYVGDLRDQQIIASRAWADKLFPDGDALGQWVTNGSGSAREQIIGIVDQMANSWIDSEVWDLTVVYAGPMPFGSEEYMLVRLEDRDQIESVRDAIVAELLALRSGREIEVHTLAEVRAQSLSGNTRIVEALTAVVVLLLFVTCLGIAGLTSFSVTERVGQIGTRRALGATKGQILGQFLVENWVVTSVGLAFGVVLSYALAWVIGAASADLPQLPFALVATGAVTLWIVGQLSALVPALRGARVPPVVATRAA